MNATEKLRLLNVGLKRAADRLGDVTPLAMQRFLDRFPQADLAFEIHWSGNRRELEGQMVENALYCLMTWLEDPQDVACLLTDSVPHHKLTLHIDPAWYSGLIDATAEVIAETIPKEFADEIAVWQLLRAELRNLVCDCDQL